MLALPYCVTFRSPLPSIFIGVNLCLSVDPNNTPLGTWTHLRTVSLPFSARVLHSKSRYFQYHNDLSCSEMGLAVRRNTYELQGPKQTRHHPTQPGKCPHITQSSETTTAISPAVAVSNTHAAKDAAKGTRSWETMGYILVHPIRSGE